MYKISQTRREGLEKSLFDNADDVFDKGSCIVLKSWMTHHATFNQLDMFRQFMSDFNQYRDNKIAGGIEMGVDQVDAVPHIKKDFQEDFAMWLSSANQLELINLSRAMGYIRLFKRWQRGNESKVQRFVIDLINEEHFLNMDITTLPTPRRRWMLIRRAVITGRWRKAFPPPARHNTFLANLTSPTRKFFTDALAKMPESLLSPTSSERYRLDRQSSLERKKRRSTQLKRKASMQNQHSHATCAEDDLHSPHSTCTAVDALQQEEEDKVRETEAEMSHRDEMGKVEEEGVAPELDDLEVDNEEEKQV